MLDEQRAKTGSLLENFVVRGRVLCSLVAVSKILKRSWTLCFRGLETCLQ